MISLLGGVVALLIALGVVAIFIHEPEHPKPGIKRQYKYFRRAHFMTEREAACYRVLLEAVGDQYFVFPQAALTSIFNEKIRGQDWRASRAHVNRKSVDFVLCDKDKMAPVLAIELDDWSHARVDRQERDRTVEQIFDQADMPLLRITDSVNLREKIAEKLAAARA